MWFKAKNDGEAPKSAPAVETPKKKSESSEECGYTVGIAGDRTVLKINFGDGMVTTMTMNGASTRTLIRLLEATLPDEVKLAEPTNTVE